MTAHLTAPVPARRLFRLTARRPYARPVWAALACLACALLPAGQAARAATINYPRPEGSADHIDAYAIELLALALQKAGAHYTVKLSAEHMNQGRALMEIGLGRGLVDIMVTMTSIDRERQLLPIRIPVSKGLVGWRLALLRADRADLLRDVRTLDDLKAYQAGQGTTGPTPKRCARTACRCMPRPATLRCSIC